VQVKYGTCCSDNQEIPYILPLGMEGIPYKLTGLKIIKYLNNYNNNNNIIYSFTAIGLLPVGSGYFTRKQNMKLVTTRFKSGGLHEKQVVATWNVGNHLSICL